jgi:hypothetical protein
VVILYDAGDFACCRTTQKFSVACLRHNAIIGIYRSALNDPAAGVQNSWDTPFDDAGQDLPQRAITDHQSA